ncbi:hypothetical protein NFI96_011612, partial [Prochilodus magdalenae]
IGDIIRCGQFGDLIEFSYPIGFSHWGVYEGDGHILHFAVAEEDELQRMFREKVLQRVFPSSGNILLGHTKVRREHITQVPVPRGAHIKISNGRHHGPACTATDMRRRMFGLLEEDLEYNLLTLNCEHFATFVRYGVAMCNQVRPCGRARTGQYSDTTLCEGAFRDTTDVWFPSPPTGTQQVYLEHSISAQTTQFASLCKIPLHKDKEQKTATAVFQDIVSRKRRSTKF